MKQVEVLIIGHGLAGALLSHFFEETHVSHVVVDNNHHHSASTIAAGLMDYISGKRYTLSWNSPTLIPFAKDIYKRLEQKLNTSFFIEEPSLRLFTSKEDRNFFEKKVLRPEFEGHYGRKLSSEEAPKYTYNTEGGVWIQNSSGLQTELFLEAHRRYLMSTQRYINARFSFRDGSDPIKIDHIEAKRVVFCTGAATMHLPFFSHLPFRPAQGETFLISSDQFQLNHILNCGKWFIPRPNQTFKFGATYEWENLTPEPSKKGKSELLSALKQLIHAPVEILEHQAGVRCMVSDLKPFIGFLNDHPHIGVLSGLGSKGVMFAPYYAKQLADHISTGSPIDEDVSINRFPLETSSTSEHH